MNEIFTDRVKIDAKVDEVWGYFIQLEQNAPVWMNGIHKMEKETKGITEEGTVYSFDARGKKQTTTITKLDPMKLVTLTSIQGGFQADYTYAFSNGDDFTEMTLVAKCKANGLMKILSPMIKMAIKKSDQDQLKQFKGAFESKK
ncbi:SRPBCC family protein [Pseudalkalibacillus berkeleyi]|uniref:SRPBCC family protein n=1 Tax=Pseudalkalibacillus berkeleyi TaxID=1069813 RepID=A0ABS9GZY1_9BACL|nr:SRPBCC family protein [Pseudalkalibacillus berkeleyi]MCF6137226.1 SRPBCC family protein [Pseudalkalibacillus berkeleyi]